LNAVDGLADDQDMLVVFVVGLRERSLLLRAFASDEDLGL